MKNHPNPDHPNPSHTTLRLFNVLISKRERECPGKTNRARFCISGGVAVINSSNCPSPGPGEATPRLDRLMSVEFDGMELTRLLCDLDLCQRSMTLGDVEQGVYLMPRRVGPVDSERLYVSEHHSTGERN